jgi:hypothetical protein
VSSNEDLKESIYRAHLAQGFSEADAEEVAEITMAISSAVSNIFIDVEKVTSGIEVRVASIVCGSQIVISKLSEILEAANIASEGVSYQFKGSVH